MKHTHNANPDGGGAVAVTNPDNVELLIENDGTIYEPIVQSGAALTFERKCAPGRLDFTIIKDSVINFTEGSHVALRLDGAGIFYGRVFSKQRDKNGSISVTAYDQLRYFKNKDTLVYEGITATELITRLASAFGWQTGALADTGFVIESRIEKDKTVFDIVQNALDLTLMARGELFTLYDDFGKLTLKNIADMKLDLLITEDTAENFNYKSSIDGGTYNKIKLCRENDKNSGQVIYPLQDDENIKKWGVLQYFENIDKNVDGNVRAAALLKLYNTKTRTLSIQNAFGDVRVRAGSLLPVSMGLGDIILSNFMLVERVKHVFGENYHRMNLELRGGDFIA